MLVSMVTPRPRLSLPVAAIAGTWSDAKWRILILAVATFAALC